MKYFSKEDLREVKEYLKSLKNPKEEGEVDVSMSCENPIIYYFEQEHKRKRKREKTYLLAQNQYASKIPKKPMNPKQLYRR